MNELLFSQKQYQALLSRLGEIKDDMTSIRQSAKSEEHYIDNSDLMLLLQVSNRTIQRWRKSGLLQYQKIGTRFYYRADLIMDSFVKFNNQKVEPEIKQPEPPKPAESDNPFACERCPLFLIFYADEVVENPKVAGEPKDTTVE